jgi:GTP cyclohydrolase IA
VASERNIISWPELHKAAERIAVTASDSGVTGVFGVPMGGLPVAKLVADLLGVRQLLIEPSTPDGVLIVDDLVDSGETLNTWHDRGFDVDAAFLKPHSPKHLAPSGDLADGWLVFPWERETGPESAVVRLLEHIGEDPTREGLLDTPKRVIKALTEMTGGYALDAASVLGTTFDEHSDEMVVLSGIRFSSMCEHHMLPFVGTATVGYVPDRSVVGLSKMARLVHMFAQRLQVQERMTTQIADAMWSELRPLGVGVVIKGHHMCMGVRGVREPNAEMTTSAMMGIMKHSDAARAEFFQLANGH